MSLCLRCLLLCATLLTASCLREAPPAPPPAKPRASVALRVVVVNEPELAEAMKRLRGEWAERSGGDLTVSAANWQDLAEKEAIDADLLVFPSRYLGEACVRGWLRPVRSNVLDSDTLDAGGFLSLVRHELINWGAQVMALPLGVRPAGIGERDDHSPSVSLLVRAAPQAISKERLGVLFDAETMKSRIAELAFVDALTEMVKAQEESDADQPAASALPVLGYSDRLAAVTTSSRNAASAFKLLEWLAQPDISGQLARAGEAVMPVRRMLATSPAWYDASLTAIERDELGKALVASLSQPTCLVIPRIPAVDEYLAALDEAVEAATRRGVPPEEALQKAAEQWEAITDSHGRDSQRKAYLKHLGISES